MSYDTLLYVWDGFSFIIFLVVLGSTLQSKEYFKSHLKLIVVSFLMFIGMFLFYREQYNLSKGLINPILTFFTHSSTSISYFLIVSLIVSLYTRKQLSNKTLKYIILYGLIVGIIMGINVSIGNIVTTHILYGLIVGLPLLHLVIYIIAFQPKPYKNIFLIQVFVLVVVYILKTINLIVNIDTLTLFTPNNHEIGTLMVSNIVLYSFIISYLIVSNIYVNKELNAHKSIIEASLSKAIELGEIDPLTNVYNRRKIDTIINNYLTIDQRRGAIFSLVLIDIDKFKSINDTHGHLVGDKVLTFIADALKETLRDVDIISRWGGDEFLLLLPNTDKETAHYVVLKLQHYFTHNKCEMIDETICLSYGVSDNLNTNTLEELIKEADNEMYLNKKQ